MSSIMPPKALAPKNTGRSPKRPVLERGKDSTAKAIRWTILSLPCGAGGGALRAKGRLLSEGDNKRQRDVEVLAHQARLMVIETKRNK